MYLSFCVVSKSYNTRSTLSHCGGQRVLQKSGIAQMIHVSVLLNDIAETLLTFVISVRHEPSTRPATSLSFVNGTILCSAVFVVVVTYMNSKMSIAFKTGNSKV